MKNFILAGCLALGFCNSALGTSAPAAVTGGGGTFTLYSGAFGLNGEIPRKYTCEGENISIPLTWKNVPPGTVSLVLIVDDIDAHVPQEDGGGTWAHWVVYNIPPDLTSFPEKVSFEHLKKGIQVGLNDWKKASYGGPCPPTGRHRYLHTLLALDKMAGYFFVAPTKDDLLRTLEGHILGKAEYIGTYQKK